MDLSSGAVLAVTVQAANAGDTTTIHATLAEAQETALSLNARGIEEVVADKGYHSGEVLKQLHRHCMRSYVPEPERGRRHWDGKAVEQKRVYENRRRIRGRRSKRLQKLRGELIERSFAHAYESGAMRRVHLRGRENILKRVVVHIGGFNLGLVMRKLFGAGKPRQFQDCSATVVATLLALLATLQGILRSMTAVTSSGSNSDYISSSGFANTFGEPIIGTV